MATLHDPHYINFDHMQCNTCSACKQETTILVNQLQVSGITCRSEELKRAVSRGLTLVAIPLRHTVLIYASAHISAFQHSSVTSVWKSKASQGKASFFCAKSFSIEVM